MCDLFHACLYFKEAQSLKKKENVPKKVVFFKGKKWHTPSLIMKYCVIIKARVKLVTERTYSCVSGVFCNVLDTDWWCNNAQVTNFLAVYVLYVCTQEMSSFHFQIITSNIHTLNFYPLCHHFEQFSREKTHMPCLYRCKLHHFSIHPLYPSK